MKTNQRMLVKIGDYRQEIDHMTMMGNLNSLWDYGNGLRSAQGKNPLDLKNYLRRPETLEFALEIERDLKGVESTPLELVRDSLRGTATIEGGKLTVIQAKMGKGGGTWAHLYILLDAAAQLDPSFKLLVYKTFVTNRILQWRDDGGDQFIALNAAIDAYLPGRDGKDNHGLFIQVATRLKAKIAPDENDWNKASYWQAKARADIEKRLVDLLQLGLVRDWDHLKELIDKL